MIDPTAADNDRPPTPDALYRTLVTLRIHHDRMLWSRVQLLIAVQGAVIGGSYAIGNHQLAAVFMSAGVFLSLVIYELVTKDQMDRDANTEIIDALGDRILPHDIADDLAQQGRQQPYVRMSSDPPRKMPFARGRYLIRIVVWAFILFDLALATLHFMEIAPVTQSG